MEKNHRVWSGERLVKNDSIAVQAAAICGGDVAAVIVAASSVDLVCESVAYV